MQYTTCTFTQYKSAKELANDRPVVRVLPITEVETFTISIEGYVKHFGARRASLLEKNIGCCFFWEEGEVHLAHRKLHYSHKKWWQFWKRCRIIAVTLEIV